MPFRAQPGLPPLSGCLRRGIESLRADLSLSLRTTDRCHSDERSLQRERNPGFRYGCVLPWLFVYVVVKNVDPGSLPNRFSPSF